MDPYQAQALVDAEKKLDAARLAAAAEKTAFAERRRQARHVRATIADDGSELLPTVAGLSKHERRNYEKTGVRDLIANMVDFDTRKSGSATCAAPENCLGREISASISQDLGQAPPHGGCWVPLRISAIGLDEKSNGGSYLTQTAVSGNILDAMRAHTMVLKLGATLLTGLRYSPAFPVESAIPAGIWVDDNPGTDAPASDSNFGQRTMQPHVLAANTSISRKLLGQSSADLESWIRNRIALAHGLALDYAALFGSGTAFVPIGLVNTSGIGSVAVGASGGAPTSDIINLMEATLGTANADSPACAFLTNSIMRSKLRKIPEFTGGSSPLWDDGSMLDYPAAVSNQIPATLIKGGSSDCSGIFFCDWSRLFIGEFQGALEILTDPFTRKKQGEIELESWGAYDVLMTMPAAAVACLDVRNV